MKVLINLMLGLLILSTQCLAMSFSQPVKIGNVFNTPSDGFIFDGATKNNGTLYSRRPKWQNEAVYGKGVAQFGNGQDALYVHYDVAGSYGKDKKGLNCNAKFGNIDGTNAFPFWIREQNYFIEKINTNEQLSIYVLTRNAFGVFYTNFIVLGRRSDRTFVKYFESDDIRKKYFGKQIDRNYPYVNRLYCKNDTIVIEYKSLDIRHNGEFRFKWDDKAQWFGVEQVVY